LTIARGCVLEFRRCARSASIPYARAMGSPFLRYALLQIPGAMIVSGVAWLLHGWAGLSPAAAVVLVVAWIGTDLAIYPFVRRSLLPDEGGMVGAGRLLGATGVVDQALSPEGWVRIRGELWRAQSVEEAAEIPAGARVRVCGLRGLMLFVQRADALGDGSADRRGGRETRSEIS
jgi:membrane protein implicated in regulation of membrane protease activity